MKKPTDQDAKVILRDVMGKNAITVSRFPTGLAHYVYDVETEDGENFVVRLARPDLKHFFEGAIYWYDKLQEKGVPIPKLYYSQVGGAKHGFPTMVMDRLPGKDLGEVYATLSSEQKKEIAHRIVSIQRSVGTLPHGKGYGYARSSEDSSLHSRWVDVLHASLDRSRKRIEEVGVVNIDFVDQVRNAINDHEKYFDTIQPICFLDDITTKNVLIDNGKLSGIVDVDSVAFGDSLFTPALTKMSLLSSGYDTEYIDYWVDDLELNADQQKALDLYTALFCVDFFSQIGHAFNEEETPAVNKEEIGNLTKILNGLV